MPFVRLTLQPAPAAMTRALLAEGLTQLMANVLGKNAALTSVLVETPAEASWSVGGADEACTAMVTAYITSRTNSAADKEAFIAAAHALLHNHLPQLAPIAYIIVTEVAPDSWGYDGLTQAARKAAVVSNF